MTLILELSADQENLIRDYAARVGMDPAAYVKSLIDTLPSSVQQDDKIDRIVAAIGRHGPHIDTSRENIYAEF